MPKKNYEQLYYDLLYKYKKLKKDNQLLQEELENFEKFSNCRTKKSLVKTLIKIVKSRK